MFYLRWIEAPSTWTNMAVEPYKKKDHLKTEQNVVSKQTQSVVRGSFTWKYEEDIGAETKNMNYSWGTIQRLASDRQGWRSFVAALYLSWRGR